MKKFLTILLGIALILPLYSQEYDDYDYDDDDDYEYDDETDYETTDNEEVAPHEIAPYEVVPQEIAPHEVAPKVVAPKEVAPQPAQKEKPKKEPAPEPEKKNSPLARQLFEIGFDAGIGFDNGLAGFNDILKKEIVIDLKKIAQSIPEDGSGFNFGLSMDFFMDMKNIHIGKGLWDFGFIIDLDGNINMNLPKSLFKLISEGNDGQHDTSGKIGASGSIFTEIGLKTSAKYQVGRRSLHVGFKPAFFTPAVYIPSSTGISYHLYTERDKIDSATGKPVVDSATGKPVIEEGLFLDTGGGISVYTPTSLENIEPLSFIVGPNGGFDLSLGAEYALFPFLDIGGNVTHIPITAATLTNEMILRLVDKATGKDFSFNLSGDSAAPELDFGQEYYNNVKKEVHRPLQFDLYAHYRPFKSDFLAISPNIGFTVNFNQGDEKWYLNGGLEVRVSLFDFIIIYAGSGYKEEIWRQRLGLGINLRVFELDLEAMLRNQTFEGCFQERGLGISLGMRFGL